MTLLTPHEPLVSYKAEAVCVCLLGGLETIKGPLGSVNSDWNVPKGVEASPRSHHLLLLCSLTHIIPQRIFFNPYLIRHVGGEPHTDLKE